MSEIKTGTDVIRQALRAWKLNLAALARDLHLTNAQVESFLDGGPLADDALKALANRIWAGHAEFDETQNLLRPTNRQEARPLGSGPPPLDPATLPKFKGGPPGPGPQPVSPPKQEQTKTKRAGWVE